MKQMTLSSGGFDRYTKQARRAAFLAEMNSVVPWEQLCALIEPIYPKAGNGHPPVGLERLLRTCFLQNWFNLSDPAVEVAFYDSLSMREFAVIDLGREGAPDETTVCKFHHLLKQHELGKRLFEKVGRYLQSVGLKVSTGAIVDATIVNVPPSTKSQDHARNPEMHQTKKGNLSYFGMKVHVGMGSKAKLIHSVAATPTNEHDKHSLPDLLHGNERRVYGDAAYSSQKDLIAATVSKASDFTNEKDACNKVLTEQEREVSRRKYRVRTKVEHVFLAIKRIFGFVKACYRGLIKEWHRMVVALANLFMARCHLLRLSQERCA